MKVGLNDTEVLILVFIHARTCHTMSRFEEFDKD